MVRIFTILSFLLIWQQFASAQVVARNDFFTVLKSGGLDLDPADNDDYADILTILEAPGRGVATVMPGDTWVRYIPDDGYVGLDTFRYLVCDDGTPDCDDAYVLLNIIESDLDSLYVRDRTTYIDKVLPLYADDVRINMDGSSSFDFDLVSITVPPSLGSAVVLSSSGYVLYTPPSGFVGVDSLQLEVCDDDAGLICRDLLVRINVVDTCNPDLCLYPGDVNRDGIVDHRDLVGIGWAFNSMGFPRDSVSLTFLQQSAIDWEFGFEGNNSKFSDCDGDGFVTAADTIALAQNYQLTSARDVYSPTELAYSDVPLSAEVLFDTAVYGDTIKVKVKLGKPSRPGSNVYAFTAELSYAYPAFDSVGWIGLDFSESWIASPGSSLHFYRVDTVSRLINVSLTRTDQTGVAGFGTIFTINLITEDNLDQRPDAPGIHIDGEIHQDDRERIRVYPVEVPAPVLEPAEVPGVPVAESIWSFRTDIQVFPNPLNSGEQLLVKGLPASASLEVVNLWGQRLFLPVSYQPGGAVIGMNEVPPGLYRVVIREPEAAPRSLTVVVR